MTTAQIGKFRSAILDGIGPSDFKHSAPSTFWRPSGENLLAVTVDFLDRSHASRFNSNTASFGLELGVFFTFIPRPNGEIASSESLPPHFECHLRGALRRGLTQVAPASGYSLEHRLRRDIWWVAPDGRNLDRVVQSANRVLRRQSGPWFGRFSNPEHVSSFLEHNTAQRGTLPFNVGRRGSPFRKELLGRITEHIGGAGRSTSKG